MKAAREAREQKAEYRKTEKKLMDDYRARGLIREKFKQQPSPRVPMAAEEKKKMMEKLASL